MDARISAISEAYSYSLSIETNEYINFITSLTTASDFMEPLINYISSHEKTKRLIRFYIFLKYTANDEDVQKAIDLTKEDRIKLVKECDQSLLVHLEIVKEKRDEAKKSSQERRQKEDEMNKIQSEKDRKDAIRHESYMRSHIQSLENQRTQHAKEMDLLHKRQGLGL